MAKDSGINGTIYRISNKTNGKQYIGQTIQTVEQRWKRHLRTAYKSKHIGALQSAILKYGEINFCITVLETGIKSIEALNKLEQLYIKELDTFGKNGYNLTTGGEGYTVSDETRKKLSQYKGRRHTEKTKNILRSKAIGRLHTEETKKKLSQNLIGNKYSDPSIFIKMNKAKTNTTVHEFYHEQHGTVNTYCQDLAFRFDLSCSAVHNLVNGTYKTTKGWIIYGK